MSYITQDFNPEEREPRHEQSGILDISICLPQRAQTEILKFGIKEASRKQGI